MSTIHFQLEKEHTTYDIKFEPSDVWSPEEVLIDGNRYQLTGDREQLEWLRSQIPQFLQHENISLTNLRSRLIAIGAHDISVSEKIHEVGIEVLSKYDQLIATLQKRLEAITARKLSLQKQLQEAKDLHAPTVESLRAEVIEAKKAEMDAYLQYEEAKEQFRGNVLIRQNGRDFYFRSFGPKDPSGEPNTRETRFCIASMTKQFTGASIALLMQNSELITNPEVKSKLRDGTLSLDTPIKDLLPAKYWSEKWEGITLEQLIHHTSGIADYEEHEPSDDKRSQTFSLNELIEMVKQKELLFNPGEMHCYSNSGYVLLGAIIENLSGKPLKDFMEENIFSRCAMNHTGLISSFADYDEKCTANGFHRANAGALQPNSAHMQPIHISKAYAAGGLISTVDDLAMWNEALSSSTLFTDATKKMMFSCPDPRPVFNEDQKEAYDLDTDGRYHPKAGKEYPESSYGFGVVLLKTPNFPNHEKEGAILNYSGLINGFCSRMDRFIPSKTSVIILENISDVPTRDAIISNLVNIMYF